MSDGESQGCITAILKLLGIKHGHIGNDRVELPFRRRDDFLSPAELSFYLVLRSAVAERAVICPKVNLADIFFVVNPKENWSHRNRIDRKHVDFLLCNPLTMKPTCGVELDDSSHARPDRQDRDQLVDAVFATASIPLVRIPARAAYREAEVLNAIETHLKESVVPLPLPVEQLSGTPNCPKCGVPMVQRLARKGHNAGQRFYGCPNYPKCREVQRKSTDF